MLRFSLASSLRLFAGGHRGVVTPVPIPNTEVKGSFAEGSAGLARARVGRRRQFFLAWRVFEGTKGTKETQGTALVEAPRQTAASQWLGDILVRKRLEISSLLSRVSLKSLVPFEGT